MMISIGWHPPMDRASSASSFALLLRFICLDIWLAHAKRINVSGCKNFSTAETFLKEFSRTSTAGVNTEYWRTYGKKMFVSHVFTVVAVLGLEDSLNSTLLPPTVKVCILNPRECPDENPSS